MLGWLHTASRVCQNLCFAYSLPVLVDYIDDSEQILDICSALAAECQISQLEKVKKCFFFQLPICQNIFLKKRLCSMEGNYYNQFCFQYTEILETLNSALSPAKT